MSWGCWHGVPSQETKACCCSQGNRMTLLWTKRDKNKAKIMRLGLGTFVTQPFQLIISWCHPQRALTLSLSPPTCPPSSMSKTSRPTRQPILGGALISSAFCWPGPQSSGAGSVSPRLAKCMEDRCQNHPTVGHTLGGREEAREAQEEEKANWRAERLPASRLSLIPQRKCKWSL